MPEFEEYQESKFVTSSPTVSLVQTEGCQVDTASQINLVAGQSHELPGPVEDTTRNISRGTSGFPTHSAKRVPWRLSRTIFLLCFLGIAGIAIGVFQRYFQEEPLQEFFRLALAKPLIRENVMHQIPYSNFEQQSVPSGVVVVATRPIAPGDIFTADNVAQVKLPPGTKPGKTHVINAPNLYGLVANATIRPGQAIDARRVDHIEGMTNYLITFRPIVKGEPLSNGKVRFMTAPSQRQIPPNIPIAVDLYSSPPKAARDIPPGTILVSDDLQF